MPEQFKIDYRKNGRTTASTALGCERRCGCIWKSKAQLQSSRPLAVILCPHNCCLIEDIGMNELDNNCRIQLSNGVHMPYVGLGTSHCGGYSHSTVVYALKECEYRLIDTAKRYGTEEFIAKAINDSCIPREELFLASKLWPTDYGYESTKSALRGSLKRLGIDYIDLFLIHWPEVSSKCTDKWQTLTDTWRALESLYDEGLCKAIGVSNYDTRDLERLLSNSSVTPHVNQIEFHPYQNPKDLRDYCVENKIQIQGYCPLGKGELVKEQKIIEMAEAHDRTPAQVLIRWSLQNGVPTIPKSTKEKRVKENFGVFDFTLSEGEMNILNNLHDGRKYIDGSKIKDKIDSQLPDGYKLEVSSELHNHRRQS